MDHELIRKSGYPEGLSACWQSAAKNLAETFAPSARRGTRIKARFSSQAGVSSVEFALVSVLLCAGLFGAMELCRIFWVWNSAAEVTVRAARLAAVLPFGATSQISRTAVLQAGSTQASVAFPGISELTSQSVQIQYMTGSWGALSPTTNLPADGVQNLENCTQGLNPCISAVQASLCQSATLPCQPLDYQSLWISVWGLKLQIPVFTVTVPLQSAGATQA